VNSHTGEYNVILMMLGASKAQIPGIIAAKELGHQVITCDYLPDAPGHQLADHQLLISTFHEHEVLAAARKHKIDGIMTMGTDQPVYTAAYVAEALSLPSLISTETALRVTNKEEMKKIFDAFGLPCASSILYTKGVNDDVLQRITYPVVIKPVDSQGQRGVYFLEDAAAVENHYDRVIQHSRKLSILVEEFYPHQEITVSGWVIEGIPQILTITDRVTFEDKKHIGICLSHEFPSKFCSDELTKFNNEPTGKYGFETDSMFSQEPTNRFDNAPASKPISESIGRFRAETSKKFNPSEANKTIHSDKDSKRKNEKNSIAMLTQRLVQAFQIESGPIYFQFFMGNEGLKVNEVACRIGGAYESSFIPIVTGVDICKLHVKAALGKVIERSDLLTEQKVIERSDLLAEQKVIERSDRLAEQKVIKHSDLFAVQYDPQAHFVQTAVKNQLSSDLRTTSKNPLNLVTHLSVQLFFAEPCKIAYIPNEEDLLALDGVIEAGLFKKTGQILSEIDNATSRIGYAIIVGNSKDQVEGRLERLYQVLKVEDEDGINHIIHRTSKQFTVP